MIHERHLPSGCARYRRPRFLREELIDPARVRVLTALLVAILTFALFSTTLSHGFMNWDDDVYVYANPAFHPLNAEGVARLASGFYYYAYIPATMLSHAADVAVWGMNPRGHHLTNVLLHTANAVWVVFPGLALLEARRGSRKGGDARRGAAGGVGVGIAAGTFARPPPEG